MGDRVPDRYHAAAHAELEELEVQKRAQKLATSGTHVLQEAACAAQARLGRAAALVLARRTIARFKNSIHIRLFGRQVRRR